MRGRNLFDPRKTFLGPVIHFLVFGLSLTLCVSMSAAKDSKLERLGTWGQNRGWEGVGLLNIAGQATCTGVMIRTDLVLTAAHCLYDLDTGKMYEPTTVEFRAGWRDGKAVASRYGKASILHPDFVESSRQSGDKIRSDVALLHLNTPILSSHADPFETSAGARTGNDVSVVSYGYGRNDAASRQRSCKVLEASDGLVAMSCDVVPGSSGSPVFADHNGRPRIVSLISSLGDVAGQSVSFGMDIERPLARVLADFRAGRGVYPRAVSNARRVAVDQPTPTTLNGRFQGSGGAHFLRP